MEIFFLLALDDLRLLERREERKLRQFFATIRDGYHTDNPYHNFYHAIHVFQVKIYYVAQASAFLPTAYVSEREAQHLLHAHSISSSSFLYLCTCVQSFGELHTRFAYTILTYIVTSLFRRCKVS